MADVTDFEKTCELRPRDERERERGRGESGEEVERKHISGIVLRRTFLEHVGPCQRLSVSLNLGCIPFCPGGSGSRCSPHVVDGRQRHFFGAAKAQGPRHMYIKTLCRPLCMWSSCIDPQIPTHGQSATGHSDHIQGSG